MTALAPSSPTEILAELAERRLTTGRNKPITVFARGPGPDASAVQCVIKPRNRLTQPPLEYLCEWIASQIAIELGLTTPTPYVVRIDQAFAQSVIDPDLRSDLLASVGLVFGSEYVSDDYTQYVHGLVLSPGQKAAAAHVLGFDVFTHNPDRRADNPNLFVNRNGFVLFDHEAAFSFLLPIIGAPPPATDPALDIVSHHVFRHALGKAPDLGSFEAAVCGLTDGVLTTIASSAPTEWTTGSAQGKLTKIMEVLRDRRDAVKTWLPQLQAGVTP
ncbi:MAG: hypothetical protein H6719_00280 [Sandaracinaceae bacterium]|nr:hypothetical protein [Sandaracinaceae bacterium]